VHTRAHITRVRNACYMSHYLLTYLLTYLFTYLSRKHGSGVSVSTSVLCERYYVTFALCYHISVCRLSRVCRLSSATFVHLYSRGLNFSASFLPGLGNRAVCVEILERNSRGSRWLSKLNGDGLWKIGVLGPISRCTSETIEYTAIVAMQDEISAYNGWPYTRPHRCNFQWPWTSLNDLAKFLPRDATHNSEAYAVVRCRPSVCLSVRHVRVFCRNESTFSQTFSSSGSHTILIFYTKRYDNIPTGTPYRGRRMQVG